MVSDYKMDLPGPAASAKRFVRWMIVAVALANLIVFVAVALSLYQSFAEYEERADNSAQNLAQMLAQGIGGDIDKINLTLASAADEIDRQIASGGVDRPALNAFLGRLLARVPEIISLRATDARGIVQYGLGVNPAARLDNSDREYFIRQRDNPKAGVVVAKPVLARIDKKWVVPLSRAIRLPDGSFGGVVYVNISLDHLTRILATIDVGQRGSASLRDADLRIYARHPVPKDVDKVIGETLAVPELQELIQSGRDAGRYVTSHTVDRIERKFAVRRVPGYPLYAVVGRATEEYMARWRDQAIRTSMLVILFSLTTLVSSWLVYRNWRRQFAATMGLAREEEKFHTVADYTYDWEYWEGPGHELLFMSPSCERVTGYTQAEFLADPDLLYRVIHPDDRHLMDAHRHDVGSSDDAGVDFRIVRRGGEIRWIAHGCRGVWGRDGRFMGRRASNRDITERKQVEHEIRLAYAYNRSLIEASLDPLVTIGPDGKITDVNSATEAVTGYPRNRLIGTEFSDYFSDPAKARAGYLQVFREGSVRDYELELRHQDGRLTPVLYNAAIYRDDAGKVIGVFAAARDITERKQVEHEIRLAYAYNRSLIEASLDPLVTIGPDGKITDVNSATEAVTGYPRNRLIGTEFSDYFSDPARARAGYLQVFREGSVRDYELEIRHQDGRLRPVLYNAAIYRDDAGKVIGVFAAARDISERKEAEGAVRRLNAELELRVAQRTAQLEAANKELEEFSYSMSHDMRTPLRALDGFSRILMEEHGAGLNEEGNRLLKALRDNARHMARLIDDILRFLSAGRRRMNCASVNIAELASEIFAELRAAAPGRGLRLEIGDLPLAWADHEMMRQVVRELLSNAIKFSPDDGEALIEVGGATAEDEDRFYVRDRGVGFDMRYADKLFRVFERVHPTGQYEGTSIGLAIVKRVVERHGGRVWADGKVGEGATFHFALPRRRT